MFKILGFPGWGSAIAEGFAELALLPYQTEDVDPGVDGPARDRLRALNPLGQVPTVVLDDGSVLTESAAIAFYMADLAPATNLVPSPGDPARPMFLRWLVFLVAAIYPTFTFGDFPARYVTDEQARKELRASTDALRKEHYLSLESAAQGPFFLGERLSAIDVYVWVMVRWRPGRAWFEENTPKLAAIARTLDGDARLDKVKARNFPG